MTGTPVRILLARHGETEFNAEGRWQGQSDSPLTERGRAQARELGEALRDEPLAAVYSSDLGRAVVTARAIAAPHGLDVQQDARLREIDVGGWTGLNRAEIGERYPGLLQQWRTSPVTMVTPGGEWLVDAQARALAFVDDSLAAHAGQTVAIVAHGALLQVLLVSANGGSLADLWLPHVENCQVRELSWTSASGLQLVDDALCLLPQTPSLAREGRGLL